MNSMHSKPIFVATHPRACSTAFERVFMTCRDSIRCAHEPFGDAWYYGPEFLARRFRNDPEARKASPFSDSTYKIIFDRLLKDNSEGKRVLIKDMAQYFFSPPGEAVSIAPSLLKPEAHSPKRGVGTKTNGVHVNGVHVNGVHTNGDVPNGVQLNGDHPKDVHVNGNSAKNVNGDSANGYGFKTQASHLKKDSIERPGTPYRTPVEPSNPTVVPTELLQQFHFAFLIRHPARAIPSYYRCCVPPLSEVTGFEGFSPEEAGYAELRQLFDYLRGEGMVGPPVADPVPPKEWVNGDLEDEKSPPNANGVARADPMTAKALHEIEVEQDIRHEICVVDADDLLDHPKEVIASFCASVGIPFSDKMLNWATEEEQEYARETFEKWKGFHDDVLGSQDLKPRVHKRERSRQEEYDDWVNKYGVEAADIIQRTVEQNVADYEYLKQFAVKVA